MILSLASGFDVVVVQMVLHYAEDPAAVLAEAARVLMPGGLLVVVDLAAHDRAALGERLAHRWPGFSDDTMYDLFAAAGMAPGEPSSVGGPLEVRLWPASMPAKGGLPAPVTTDMIEQDA